MASDATTHHLGRMARAVHFLRPSRRQVAFFLVTEAVLTAMGAPFWLHLIAGGLLHPVIVGLENRP